MKSTLLASAVLALAASAAFAQQAPVKVPTGIDVPGSTFYVIPAGETRVVQVAEPCNAAGLARRSPLCAAASGGERPDKEVSNNK